MEQADAEGTADLWTHGSAKLLIDDELLVFVAAMLTAIEGMAATWDVSGWFDDPELAVSVSGLPGWLTFDSAMMSLTIAAGVTDDEHVDTHEFEVTATDEMNKETVHTTTLTVENVHEVRS